MEYIDTFTHFLESKSDPRTQKWLLVGHPGALLTILGTYLYFCIYAGPRYMKDRKPFDLKNTIIVYNGIQVLFSIFLVYEGLAAGWSNEYSFLCQPVDYSNNPKALRMASAVWFYYICKLIELLDTVFFVLRKKNNQVSFLHLYHHTLMPVCSWIGVKFLPGGHGTLLGLINSFIHIIMYSYYFLSSMGPQFQKYLWWKKYLTAMQMVQFCIVFAHNFQLMFRPCDYPKAIVFLLGLNAGFFLYLFGSFYKRTYLTNRKVGDVKTKGDVDNDAVANASNGVSNGKLKTT